MSTEPQIQTPPPHVDTLLSTLLSPRTTEDKVNVESVALFGASGIGAVAAVSAELSRMVIGGHIFPELTNLFHSLIQRERSFYLLVYSGSDFAATFTGTLAIAAMLNLLKIEMIKQMNEKFTKLKKNQTDEKTIVLLNKLQDVLAITIEGVEFTATSLVGTLYATMWILDELAQFVGVYYGTQKQTAQFEDLYAYLYGFSLAMAIYTTFKIRAYISYYGAKDENNEQES